MQPTHDSSEVKGDLDAGAPNLSEIAAGRDREELQGWVPELATATERRIAFEKAFDYRGDVTLTLHDGRVIQGYIFDRRVGSTLEDSFVRVIPAGERTKLAVPYDQIAALTFSGRDTAAGKSFEAWVRKYQEKKAAGEQNIAIEPETLE